MAVIINAADLHADREASATKPQPEPAVTDAVRPKQTRAERSVSRRTQSRGQHIEAIDGLRAVAVLGVLAFHLNALPGGFLGVDLFFVISGFVITSMLLIERHRSGRINLRQFWWRRAKRLLPAVLAVLLVVQLWLHMTAPAGLEGIVNGQSISSLFSATNWYDIFANFGYWDADSDASPLNHLWSLAIEEQFYLLLPLLLFFLRSRRAIAAVAATAIVVSIAVRFTIGAEWSFDRLYQGTDIRVVALLAGVLLATVVVRPTNDSTTAQRFTLHSPAARIVAGAVALLGALATAWMWITLPLDDEIFSGALLLATLTEVALVAVIVIDPKGWLSRALRTPLLTFIGRRSYALYLWHWPVIVIVSETHTGMSGVPLAVARVLLIAAFTLLSYALIENPIRRSNGSVRAIVAGLAVPAVVIAVMTFVSPAVTAALLPQPEKPAVGADAGSEDSDWKAPPIIGGSNVMVLGDSWAVNLANGMSDPEFGTKVQSLGIGGCGILNPDAYKNDQGEPYAPPASVPDLGG